MTRQELQDLITEAANCGLSAVTDKAFEMTKGGVWRPKKDCLTGYYSGGEKVLCSILICFWFEEYGHDGSIRVPRTAEYTNHISDLIWPGGYWFMDATRLLTMQSAWKVIKKMLLVE